MRAYISFVKKEFMEYTRNYKLFILLVVFVILGILSPLTAKFMPEMIKSFMPAGMTIELPPSSSLDSWGQFFKNITQMGFIVLMIVFSGIMSKEYDKGTFVNMVTKGLGRETLILSKFTAASLLWTICCWVSFLITWGYTRFYWNDSSSNHLIVAVLILNLFGLILLAIELLGAVIIINSYGSLLFVVGFIIVLFILNIFPKLEKYNPLCLVNQNLGLVKGSVEMEVFKYPAIIGAVILIGFVVLSIKIFNKKQI
jgi:ABC-2 type transport system permease protein